MSEDFHDKKTADEMSTVAAMIKRAEQEGLLVEVIWTLAQSNYGTAQEKCYHALHEWDC